LKKNSNLHHIQRRFGNVDMVDMTVVCSGLIFGWAISDLLCACYFEITSFL